MKNITLFILSLTASVSLNAQFTYGSNTTIYTPKGSAVQGNILTSSDYTSGQQTTIQNDIAAVFPYVTFISPATASYNCHDFAWNISTGHTDQCYIPDIDNSFNPNVSKYWTDGSYLQVCVEGEAKFIHYYNGDHSAIRSSVSGKWESKWGNGPLIRHDIGEVESVYSPSDRHYYADPQITGTHTELCTSGTKTFSVPSYTNGTYSWTCGPGLQAVGSSSGTSFTCERSNSTDQLTYVDVSITTSCGGSVTRRYSFWAGATPDITDNNTLQIYYGPGDENIVCSGDENYFDFNVTGGGNITWTLSSAVPGGLSYATNGAAQLYLYMWHTNQVAIFYPSNNCGDNTSLKFAFKAVNCSARFSISPNPASTEVNITALDNITTIKEIRIVTKQGELKKRLVSTLGTNISKVNIESLVPDTYVIQVFDGKVWMSRQIIKK